MTSTLTAVADLTREQFGYWVTIPARGAAGYLYAIHDEYHDGYPSRTVILVGADPYGTAYEEEFSDHNPFGYPKTMGTACTVQDDRPDVDGHPTLEGTA